MQLDLDDDLVTVLRELDKSRERAARELIVVELYRPSVISPGKAAEPRGMPLLEFIRHAADLGIPYFRFDEDAWGAERAASDKLVAAHRFSAARVRSSRSPRSTASKS